MDENAAEGGWLPGPRPVEPDGGGGEGPAASFVRRVLVTLGAVAALGLGVLLVYTGIEVLLLVFAGVLVALLLSALASALSRHTPLGRGWALLVVVLTLLGLGAGGVLLLAPSVATQAQALSERLPQSVERLRERAQGVGWVRWLEARAPAPEELMPARRDAVAQATGAVSATLGLLANALIVLFVALYLAADPGPYVRGLVRLFPLARRPRMAQVLDEVGSALRWWLLGKLLSMALVGVLSTLGLWLLGVPLALTLGLLAALLTFIPNIGPALALAPPVLLALMESPRTALYVVALYLGVQVVESYLFTPLIQKRTVSLAPVLGLIAQVLLGVLLGGLGVVLATPLIVAALVLVRRLYLEDALGERPAPDSAQGT